jgi:multidrug efflux system membrane fusion protein
MACVLLAMTFTGGCGDSSDTAGDRQGGPPTVSVSSPVVKQIVEWDRFTGRLESVQFVEVRSRVSGAIESIHFSEGELVEAGQLLFVIDQRPFRAALRTAVARQMEAEAMLKKSRTAVLQAEASKSQASAKLELANARLNRALELIRQNAISEEEVDIRRNDSASAEADLTTADAAIAGAEAGVSSAEAMLATATAEKESAELDLEYTEVTSPIEGRISDWRVNVGNLITGGNQGATLLTTIVSLDPIHAYFDANEQQLLKYSRLHAEGKRYSSRRVKNPVYLALADEQGFPHLGHMDFVDNRIDPNTGTIRARAIFSNPDGLLLPGLFARIRIPGSAPYDAILVPDAVVLSDQADQFVYLVNAENKVVRSLVTPGPMSHGLRVIRDGISADDRVVLDGLQRIQAGMQVQTEPGTIEAEERDVLPDTYEPIPQDQWLNVPPAAATSPGQGSATDSPATESPATESPATESSTTQPPATQPAAAGD